MALQMVLLQLVLVPAFIGIMVAATTQNQGEYIYIYGIYTVMHLTVYIRDTVTYATTLL